MSTFETLKLSMHLRIFAALLLSFGLHAQGVITIPTKRYRSTAEVALEISLMVEASMEITGTTTTATSLCDADIAHYR